MSSKKKPVTNEEIARSVEASAAKQNKVMLISPPFIKLPVSGYAGIERVVWDEARGLAKRGWRVYVIAPTDSKPDVCQPQENNGFAMVVNIGVKFEASLNNTEEAYFEYWRDIVKKSIADGFVIHDHTHKKHVYTMVEAKDAVIVSTVHDDNPFGSPPPVRSPNLVGVSVKHAEKLSMALGVPVETVYNGVDLDQFKVVTKKQNYALFFSRISSIKGVHEAIAIAREAGVQLVIAGSDTFVDDPGYVVRIMGECDGKNVIYLGEVSEEKKRELMENARCLLFPTLFDEPFGIVAVEAMACGTPVVTSSNGAMPEVVGHMSFGTNALAVGNGGYVCRGRSAYVAAVTAVFKGDPAKFARRARKQASLFSSDRMVAEYERVLLKAKSFKW